jgi:hypothetical protein
MPQQSPQPHVGSQPQPGSQPQSVAHPQPGSHPQPHSLPQPLEHCPQRKPSISNRPEPKLGAVSVVATMMASGNWKRISRVLWRKAAAGAQGEMHNRPEDKRSPLSCPARTAPYV